MSKNINGFTFQSFVIAYYTYFISMLENEFKMDKDRSSELFQETVIKLGKKWKKSVINDPISYTRRIIINLINDTYKGKAKDNEFSQEYKYLRKVEEDVNINIDSFDSKDDAILQEVDDETLKYWVDQLPKNCQEFYRLTIDQKTRIEIAKELGLSLDEVQVLRDKIVYTCKKELKKRDEDRGKAI